MFDSSSFSSASFSSASFGVSVAPSGSTSGGKSRLYREEFERSLLIQQDQQDFLDLIYIVGRIVEKIKSM